MVGVKGPKRPELVKKLLKELSKRPEGIWSNKLARIIKEPRATVHKYVTTTEYGYPGEKIEIINQLPQELGGNIMIRLKRGR